METDIATMVADQDFSLDDFVTTWVSACTTAEGKAMVTTIELLGLSLIMFVAILFMFPKAQQYSNAHDPRLEPLKSQSELIKMINQSSMGMAEIRKELQAKQKTLTAEALQTILRKAMHTGERGFVLGSALAARH